jgi:hypothetical protein
MRPWPGWVNTCKAVFSGLDTTKELIGKTKQRNQAIEHGRTTASGKLQELAERARQAHEEHNDQIEPPLTLALSVLILGERVNRWVVAGAVASFVGVALTIFLQQLGDDPVPMMGLAIGRGEVMALAGALAAAISTVISKMSLSQVPLGLFNIVRTAQRSS